MDRNDLLKLASAYQSTCILSAAADLDLFSAFPDQPFSLPQAAQRLAADPRALAMLLDALAALGLLAKSADQYAVPPDVASLLDSHRPGNLLAMVQHQANCMRRWVHLARVVKTGRPAERQPSIRGEAADWASFIEAMDNISAPVARQVINDILPLSFNHLIDVGGGSGTWTIAFLSALPSATATLFDLPHVLPQARERLAAANLASRVNLVGGDYTTDPLPPGADAAFLGAIIHSLSREENRRLYASIHRALAPAGQLLIRDIIMEPSRTAPPGGALFAINMLTGTPGGGTFTLDELREDLAATGFTDVKLLRRDEWMNSILSARRTP